ncbi:MAG TPA: zinc-binding dehydrogenase, partial [Candidatus Micrarchaeaceae archaeon]|nr:zinc-binding dehydrogenase [Candidatus Micrarchaeaceae archaeon]
LTRGNGVDVVFEHVGQATWDESMKSLAVAGRLVTCGATTGPDVKIDIRHLFVKQISVLGSFMGGKSELFPPLELFARGRVKPVIDEVLPLEKCAEAHRRLENREQFGKIVLKV